MYDIKELQVNEDIRVKEVRLIGADGEQIGIISTKKALDMARDKRLDLVNVAPNAKPPVCKIIDYGKYKYEAIKKAKEAKKRQSVITVKEIRMSPNIDTHDLEVKARRAVDFFNSGDRVKVSVRFRGREMNHTEIGRDVLNKFVELTDGAGVIDKKPNMEGRNMVMFMSPNTEG
ncbi:MAG: translation initiation factor IF-3 [Tissierellia bacterium]|nr:translation initiation factor IF-3 [Tissierellia bacterium]